MRKKNGFTLIELLATIVILGLITSLTIYISLDVINKSREKTYQVTINNVIDNANSYLLENTDKIDFILDSTESYEYQCLKVKDLIEYGYLKENVIESKISNNEFVSRDNYIYVERDKNTKTITKSIYVTTEDTNYSSVCGTVTSAVGYISFRSNPDANVWSREKEVTITYRLKNINNISELGNYQHDYNFIDQTDEGNFNNYTITKTINVTTNGTINANIKKGSNTVVIGNYEISKIDRIPPQITLENDQDKKYINSEKFYLKVTDTESGVNYNSFTKDDIEVTIGGNIVSDIVLSKLDNEGNYTLTVTDTTNRGSVEIKIKEETIFDNAQNGNGEKVLKPSGEWGSKEKAVITCNNSTFNDNYQLIASCSGGTVVNAWQRSADDYIVTCVGDDNHEDADPKICSIDGVCYSVYISQESAPCYSEMNLKLSPKFTYHSTRAATYINSFLGYDTGFESEYFNGERKTWIYSIDHQCYVSGRRAGECGLSDTGYSGSGGNGGSSANGCASCSVSTTISCNDSSFTASACGTLGISYLTCPNSTGIKSRNICTGTISWTCNSKSYTRTLRQIVGVNSYCPSTCFLAGTKVMTPDGYKDIDKVEVGDLVLSYNEETKKNEYNKVAYHFEFEKNETGEELYTLTFDDNTDLKVTSKHKFYVERDNMCSWLPAEEMNYGDIVKYADGSYHKLIKTEHTVLTQPVYNLSVENTHNFYVGDQQVLVHNVGVKKMESVIVPMK